MQHAQSTVVLVVPSHPVSMQPTKGKLLAGDLRTALCETCFFGFVWLWLKTNDTILGKVHHPF